MRTLILLTALTLAFSAEPPIATWTSGPGTIAGVAAAPGDPIAPGNQIIADGGDVHLTLRGFKHGDVLLQTGSVISITHIDGEDGRTLLVSLDATGSAQFDVTGFGPYAELLVRGFILEAKVTGTLFVLSRDQREIDQVAVVRGRVEVRLRQEVVASLGKTPPVELIGGQYLSADAKGFGEPSAFEVGPTMLVESEVLDAVVDGFGPPDLGGDIVDTIGGGALGLPPPPPF